MQNQEELKVAARGVLTLRTLKEELTRIGAADTETYVSLLETLGAAEAAFTRWYAEAAMQDQTTSVENAEN